MLLPARENRSTRQGLVVPKDYVPAAESAHALHQLQLDAYEGPLDLLLHLIKRHHLDVFDIPMAFVCERYLAHLDAMQELSLDVAAEFMFMASELMHIKSRMLLPQTADDTEDDEGDPRADLVYRLLAYQTFREAAKDMGAMPQLTRDIFARAPQGAIAGTTSRLAADVEPALAHGQALALTRAFSAALKRMAPSTSHKVVVEQVSMRLRMQRLVERLSADMRAPLPFARLLDEIDQRLDAIVMFLATLEMARLKLVQVYISEHETLYIKARFDSQQAAIERISGLDDMTYA